MATCQTTPSACAAAQPDDVRTLVEIDRRRGSIAVHVATDPTRPSRTSSSLSLPPDMAEALANELLRAVQAWRQHETTVAWTSKPPAGGRFCRPVTTNAGGRRHG